MPTLVVTTQGAMLRCREGQIQVEHEQRVLEGLPQSQVERVLLLGHIGMTTAFLHFALEKRISVTFLSQYGRYCGRLTAGERGDVRLRHRQFLRLDDTAWRLKVSRLIVETKIEAQRRLLLRSHRNHSSVILADAAHALALLRPRVGAAATLPELMGCEGNAARIYFQTLPSALRRPLPFRGRNRRPPKDPVNALLSLGYGMLTAEIIGALSGVGLDPHVGVFHSSRRRMPALAEDMLEMFRAPVADALALSLVNLGVLQAEDFETQANDGMLLTKAALTTYFRHYRRRMTAPFRDRAGHPTSFRKELQAHAAHLRRVLLDEESYRPFIAPLGGARR